MSLSSRFALDRSGDIGWQFLRPSQRMADPRHFQLPRGDLTSGLSVFASGAERTLVADEHATEDQRRTLLGLRVRAPQADESFRAVLTGRQRAEVRAHVPQAAADGKRRPFIRGGIAETVAAVKRVVQPRTAFRYSSINVVG